MLECLYGAVLETLVNNCWTWASAVGPSEARLGRKYCPVRPEWWPLTAHWLLVFKPGSHREQQHSLLASASDLLTIHPRLHFVMLVCPQLLFSYHLKLGAWLQFPGILTLLNSNATICLPSGTRFWLPGIWTQLTPDPTIYLLSSWPGPTGHPGPGPDTDLVVADFKLLDLLHWFVVQWIYNAATFFKISLYPWSFLAVWGYSYTCILPLVSVPVPLTHVPLQSVHMCRAEHRYMLCTGIYLCLHCCFSVCDSNVTISEVQSSLHQRRCSGNLFAACC